ncbi:hypothetical protein Gpo141_00009876 [Globisporangium polare]
MLLLSDLVDEFILGLDFVTEKMAIINHGTCELSYQEGEDEIILPFECADCKTGGAKAGMVRLVRKFKLDTERRSQFHLRVSATEGTIGLFTPAETTPSHLLLAPTITTVREGEIIVPVINTQGARVKLPPRHSLGTWVPQPADMEVLEASNNLDRGAVKEWLDPMRSSPLDEPTAGPAVNNGDLCDTDMALIHQLLLCYPRLLQKRDDCPPPTTYGVQHHINTGDATPIIQRQYRSAVTENKTINEHVTQMLRDGVVEHGSGA